MNQTNNTTAPVVIDRTFNAPRAKVFAAWSTPEAFSKWFGPGAFTIPTCELDFRPGGTIRLCMRSPEGSEHWMNGTYGEIIENEMITFRAQPVDEAGKPLFETLNTVTFADNDGKTDLRVDAEVTQIFDPTAEMYLAGMDQGWNMTVDNLGEYVQA